MLKAWQVVVTAALGVAMWGFVTHGLRAHPERALDVDLALRGTLIAPLAGLFSVWLCRFVGRLKPEQMLAGVSVTGAVAMMLDGWAIRWAPQIYGASDRSLMFAGGGLLWSYGAAFAAAVAWALIEGRASRAPLS
ncbi:hypothetical protein [Caulobacter sp.]|uniref:hypothetical protein n=1 Tax=Caulobacter sp. TaxID=78 RepID=UPI002B48B23C|nr:hypothetical protein [Caulobacter sp.]HJV43971.1 hypothetical protein [Caulobacter sp.]